MGQSEPLLIHQLYHLVSIHRLQQILQRTHITRPLCVESPSSYEIENLYQKHNNGQDISQLNRLSICGMTRIIDFDQMVQINDYGGNIRAIKRVEKDNIDEFSRKNKIKGIAGYQVSSI